MAEFPQTIGIARSHSGDIAIERIDPLADERWDEMASSRADHTIFHRSAWARVLAETYGHQPFYLKISVQGKDAALVPLMEVKSRLTGRRGVSLPFSDFAGPLWSDPMQAPVVYAALLELAASREWKHLEIRGGLVPPAGARPFLTYDSHHLDLRQGMASIFHNLDSSVRRAIRKSQSSGIEVTVERNPQAVDDFYQLHGRTRRRHGLPPQPLEFFRNICRHLIERNFAIIVLAKLADIPVAGAVFLHSAGRAIYKFGASDSEHWPLRPNHGVMWAGIRELTKIGCDELQFGRTSPADDGLARFKLSWGSVRHSLPYFRHDCRANTWLAADHLPTEGYPLIFGHLPIACNRLAGRLIYPHLD